jgi:hypothetical protein
VRGSPNRHAAGTRGLSVRLTERSARLGDVVSGHLIKPTGVARLHRWKLLDTVLATGCPQLDDQVLWLGGQPHRSPTPAPGTGPIAPRRTALDPILLTAAAQAGADVEMGYQCTACYARAGESPGSQRRPGSAARAW